MNKVCRKPWEKVSPILVTLTSRSDSDFERSNISLKENNRDDVDLISNGLDHWVRKNEGKILWFFDRALLMEIIRSSAWQGPIWYSENKIMT